MPLEVTLAVLGAALAHATWNAMIKSSRDVLLDLTLVTFLAGLAAAPLLLFIAPPAREYLISAHQSMEVGHQAMLNLLGLVPLLDLNLRLGEGTGAALAFHLVEASARLLCEMATFDEAGVSDKE